MNYTLYPSITVVLLVGALFTSTAQAVTVATTADAAAHVAFNRSGFLDPVVALQLAGSGTVVGGGVLIAPNKILTAANLLVGPDGTDSTDTSLITVGRYSSASDSFVRSYTVISVTRHPSWLADGSALGFDLAVLELSEPMSGVAPARLLASELLGTEGAFAGFGLQGTGEVNDLELPGAGARMAAQNHIADLSSAPGDDLSNFYVVDFDNGDAEFDTDGSPMKVSLEGGLSDGDAGTGLWARTGTGDNDWALAGIAIGHGNELGESGTFGDVSAFTRLNLAKNRDFLAGQAVPEPSVAGLALVAVGLLGRRRRAGSSFVG